MKSFLEYLVENSQQYLISTFGQAKEYIEKYDCLKDTNLTLDDIQIIFDYSLSNQKTKSDIKKFLDNRPEPFVADYNGIPGRFALRKWIATKKVIDTSKISTKMGGSNKNNLFAGFHNTSLKGSTDNNVSSNWQPSAQDYESIICLAYNVRNDALNDKEKIGITEAQQIIKNIHNNIISEDEISESDRCKVFYAKHKNELDACVDPLLNNIHVKQAKGIRLDKLPNDLKQSELWKAIGKINGDENLNLKPDNTPKTDIISSNNKLRISCKKATGAQLMSGAQNETVATIITALYRTFGKEEKWPENIKIFKEQITNKRWKKIKFSSLLNVRDLKKTPIDHLTPEEISTREQILSGEKELSDIKIILHKLLTENKKFENNLLYEALTGNAKFGGKIDDESSEKPVANIIFEWDIDELDKSNVYTISEYIKHLQSGKIEVKYDFSYKTSGNTSSIGFRIKTKRL